MDPQQALADLVEISTQIETAILIDGSGSVLASTLADDAQARDLAQTARRLLAEADAARPDPDKELVQLEAATRQGSVFIVRDDANCAMATTATGATVGLVFYDLKSCLRSLADETAVDEPATGASS